MHNRDVKGLSYLSPVTPYRRCVCCGMPMEGIRQDSTLERTVGDCCEDDLDYDNAY